MSVKAELTGRDKKYLQQSLNGNMTKVIMTIGTPLALYQCLNQLFAVLDTMMAAHISKESVSAVAYLAQLNHLLTAVGGGLAVGSGILISRAYGEGNFALVRKRVSTLYMICLIVGLGMLAAILPFTNSFLRLAGTPDSLISVGSRYFVTQLFTMVITFMNNVYIAVERARGNAGRIFRLNLIVIVTKLSLTAFFVYILSGDLFMIGIASFISQCFLLVFAAKNSFDGESAFSFSIKAVTFREKVPSEMMERSVPVIAEKALFSLGKTVVNSMCTFYGDLMVGAMGVANNLGGFTTSPQSGYQEGAAAIISQNFGARKYHRVLDAFRSVLIINVVVGALFSFAELWQVEFLAGLFDSGSLAFHNMIVLVYRYEALAAIPLGINSAVLALLYGLGKTKLTLILNIARVFVFRIPVFWFFQHYTSLGQASVGIVMTFSNVAATVMALVFAILVIHDYSRKYIQQEYAYITAQYAK